MKTTPKYEHMTGECVQEATAILKRTGQLYNGDLAHKHGWLSNLYNML